MVVNSQCFKCSIFVQKSSSFRINHPRQISGTQRNLQLMMQFYREEKWDWKQISDTKHLEFCCYLVFKRTSLYFFFTFLRRKHWYTALNWMNITTFNFCNIAFDWVPWVSIDLPRSLKRNKTDLILIFVITWWK